MHYAMLTTTTINAGIVARNFRFRRGTLLSCPLDLVFFHTDASTFDMENISFGFSGFRNRHWNAWNVIKWAKKIVCARQRERDVGAKKWWKNSISKSQNLSRIWIYFPRLIYAMHIAFHIRFFNRKYASRNFVQFLNSYKPNCRTVARKSKDKKPTASHRHRCSQNFRRALRWGDNTEIDSIASTTCTAFTLN